MAELALAHAKAPPQNIEAEQAILGAALCDNEVVHLAAGLRPEHFREPLHGRLWAAIAEKVARRVLADPTLLASAFAGDAAFVEFGGLVYLGKLLDLAPVTKLAPDYAAEIVDLAAKRALIAIGDDISETARTGTMKSPELVSAAEKALSEVAHSAGAPTAWISASAVVAHAIAAAKASKGLPGLTTGLRELDEISGGFRRGVLTVIAGRPAMGKSSVGLQLARACAETGKGAVFFSMEMPEVDLGLRMACDLAHDPYAPFISGQKDNPHYFDAARARLPPEHWKRLEEAEETVRAWPLDFDVRAGLTVPQMLAAARRRFREWERSGIEPGCIILDHLTIARPDQDRNGNKVAEVGDISRGLAEMAKSLDLPVIALCQLSRDVEKRQGGDRRPNLSDLRWSGEIEQDARLVTFIYRPEYYLKKPQDPDDFEGLSAWKEKVSAVRNKLFWFIEKNNNGPTGEVETYFDLKCSAIRNRLELGGQ